MILDEEKHQSKITLKNIDDLVMIDPLIGVASNISSVININLNSLLIEILEALKSYLAMRKRY